MTDLPAESVQEMESLVVDWLDEYDVPGASVAVDADGERYAEGFGAGDTETNESPPERLPTRRVHGK